MFSRFFEGKKCSYSLGVKSFLDCHLLWNYQKLLFLLLETNKTDWYQAMDHRLETPALDGLFSIWRMESLVSCPWELSVPSKTWRCEAYASQNSLASICHPIRCWLASPGIKCCHQLGCCFFFFTNPYSFTSYLLSKQIENDRSWHLMKGIKSWPWGKCERDIKDKRLHCLETEGSMRKKFIITCPGLV